MAQPNQDAAQGAGSAAGQDFSGAEAGRKINELASQARNCMLGTNVSAFPGDFRPLAIQQVDEQGVFWFISASDSEKNRDIAKDDRVVLIHQDDSEGVFLSLSGRARIHTDRPTIDAHWDTSAELWFSGGKEDPKVTIISVTPTDGHYWKANNGTFVALAKMTFEQMTGSHEDAREQGQLKP